MSGTVLAGKQCIEIDGERLAYRAVGDPAAPPLLLLHGILSHADVWRSTYEALSASHYCIALDQLGFGDSAKPAGADYGIVAQARRALAVADALGFERFALIGHSMGGQIAQCLAAQLAPERVTTLVDVSGVTSGRLMLYHTTVFRWRLWLATMLPWLWAMTRAQCRLPVIARQEFATWFYDMNALPFESWALDREMALQSGLKASAHRALLGILAANLLPVLPQVRARTLIVFGAQDGVVPVSEGQLAHQHIPGSQLVTIDRCGHFPMYEQPEQYLAALRAFGV